MSAGSTQRPTGPPSACFDRGPPMAAREPNDVLMQWVYAAGLDLHAALAVVEDPDVAKPIEEAMCLLDDAVDRVHYATAWASVTADDQW